MIFDSIAKWFRNKNIGREWYLLFLSISFGIVLTIVSRLGFYVVDILFDDDNPTKIRPVTFAIQVLLTSGFGYYLASRVWPKTGKSEFEDGDRRQL